MKHRRTGWLSIRNLLPMALSIGLWGQAARAAEEVPADPADPAGAPPVRGHWIDRSHQEVSKRVVNAARWFDAFFGDVRYEEEAEGTRIRVRLTLRMEEGGEITPQVGISGKVALPNMEDRIQLVIESLTSSEDDLPLEDHLETVVRDIEDDVDLSAATRVVLKRSETTYLDFDVGGRIKLDDIRPFVKFRGKKLFYNEKLALRWTQYFFWETGDGFGETSRFDVDVHAGPGRLFRSSSLATWSEISHGVDLTQFFALYQQFDRGRRALGATVAADATTDPDTFTEFRAAVKYRQRFLRDWLYVELEPEAIFPEEEDYDLNPRLNLRFDMMYGDY